MQCGILSNGRVAKHMRQHPLKIILNRSIYGSYSSADVKMRAIRNSMKFRYCYISAHTLSATIATILNPRTLYTTFIVANNFTNVGICAFSSFGAVEKIKTQLYVMKKTMWFI